MGVDPLRGELTARPRGVRFACIALSQAQAWRLRCLWSSLTAGAARLWVRRHRAIEPGSRPLSTAGPLRARAGAGRAAAKSAATAPPSSTWSPSS